MSKAIRLAGDLGRRVTPSGEALTIVGASVRAAAYSARRAGFAPVAADPFADVDLQAICPATRVERYPDEFECVLNGPQPGSWMYCGALENYPDQIERWSRQRPLWGNPANALRRVRDPLLWTAAIEAADLPVPQVQMDGTGLPRDGSWLRKPLRSAGGSQITRWTLEAATQSARDVYFQQFVAGESCSAVYLAAGCRCELLGVTRQLLSEGTAHPFRYAGSIGPLQLQRDRTQQFTRIGEVLAREFSLVGLFGVDVIINEQVVWPVEINPRYTASVEVLEKVLGWSAVGLHVAACRDGGLPSVVTNSPKNCVGKLIVFADHDCSASEFCGEEYADIPATGSVIRAGQPVLTVFAEADDEVAVRRELRERASDVRAAL